MSMSIVLAVDVSKKGSCFRFPFSHSPQFSNNDKNSFSFLTFKQTESVNDKNPYGCHLENSCSEISLEISGL